MKSELDVRITTGVAIALFLIFALLEGPSFSHSVLSIASKAIGTTVTLRYIFVKWAWKWRPLRFLEKLHKVPNLEGRWLGHYASSGNQNTPAHRLTGQAQVQIVQPSLHSIKIIRRSEESISRSFGEEFIEGEDGLAQLVYSYRSEPRASVRDRSPISYGSARLTFAKDQPEQLEGDYWTDQKTTGTLDLKRQ